MRLAALPGAQACQRHSCRPLPRQRSPQAAHRPARRRQQPACAVTPLQVTDATPGRAAEQADQGGAVQLQLPRRRLEVSFTCNKCGGRSTRMVNPQAWARGTVFVQCQQCEVWHKIRDEAQLIEEVSGPGAAGLSSDGSSNSSSSDRSQTGSHAPAT